MTNKSTAEIRTFTTDSAGRYNFLLLPPGSYNLRVSSTGFRDALRDGIVLNTAQTLDVGFQLEIGSVNESMQVVASAELIDSVSANRSATLSQQTVQQLPLNQRNPLALIHSSAGVVAARTGVSQSVADQNQNRFSLNGGRHESTSVMIDGIPMGAGDWGGLIASPGVDAVQEVQIVRNTYDAEYGRTGGGVINMTTRGGGQEYHGGLFEFYRNDNLDANTFFNNRAGRVLPEFKRNQFGGTFSGPIWKSKRLLGFFGYEALRAGSPASRTSSVPTDLQRRGDFSQTRNANGSLAVIYDPLTTRPDANRPGFFLRDAFPGNLIPANRVDAVSKNVLSFYPPPNTAGNAMTNANNFYSTGTGTTSMNRYDSRVDWAHSDKFTMFGRFTIGRILDSPAIMYSAPAETNSYAKNPRFQFSLGGTLIIDPTFIVTMQTGGGRWSEINYGAAAGYDSTTLGLPASIVSQFDVAAPPVFNVGEVTTVGYNRYLNGVRQISNSQVNATKQMGAHSFKFGWTWQLTQLNFTDANGPNFNFDRYFTSGPDPDARTASNGSGFASFLLGIGSGGSLPLRVRPASTDAYHGVYFQDSWKIGRKLTVNYGIRYEIQKGRTERYDRYSYLDLNSPSPLAGPAGMPNLRGGLAYLSEDNRAQWDAPYNNFAPRVGVAYKLTEKLVVRTGYGLFYDRTTYSAPGVGTDGYSQTTPWVTSLDGNRTPINYLSNPFPGGVLPARGSADGMLTNVGQSISGFLRNRSTPYIQQYSFDLQYEIAGGFMVEAGYTGTQGRKLLYGYGWQLNQLPDQYLSMGNALLEQVRNPFYGSITTGSLAGPTVARGQLLRPYPQFTGVTATLQPGASSSYNALVTHLVKRFKRGVTFDLSYQFSKAMDNASENGSPGLVDGARNFNNLSAERSISSHDVPQSLALSFVADLPFGRGRSFGNGMSRWADAIVGGWSLSGIYRYQSGLPYRLTATNNTNSFGGSQVPNVSNYDDVNKGERTLERWFNTSAFSLPVPFTFGNAPRFMTQVRLLNVNNMDTVLAKSFRITERLRAQLRWELFNVANRTQFGWPDTNLNSNTFGQVTSLAPGATPRNMQLGLRLDF